MDNPKANHHPVPNCQTLSDEDRADLHDRLARTYGHDAVDEAVAVADGHGLVVKVERGDLEVHDGLGPYRRVRRFARVGSELRRLVVMGRQGTLSLDALAWCRHRNIAVVVLDADGAIFASSRPGRDDARLLRSQAFASGTETGLAIAQYLIKAKLGYQARILRDRFHAPDAAATLGRLASAIGEACSLEEVRQLEAAGANVYWHGWESAAEVVFARRDLPRVPEHWLRFNGRRSAVNPGSPRSATDPAGAALNYTYRLLEAEAVVACCAIGLDVSLGVLHADQPGRPSFALDVLEPCRPSADGHVLDVLAGPLRKRDFAEDARGVVRVTSAISHQLAQAMPAFAQALGPIVEHVATVLGDASPYDVTVPAVLTRSKHRAAARRRVVNEAGDALKRQAAGQGPNPGGIPPRGKRRVLSSSQPPLPFPACRGCGVVLPSPTDRRRARRFWCEECLPGRRAELDDRMRRVAAVVAEQHRVETGVLPAHTDEAQGRRRDANRRRQLARLAWEADHGGESPDVDWYSEQIAPKLVSLSLTEIAGALGVSTSSASKFRSGLRVPAPRHWEALARLVGVGTSLSCVAQRR